MDTEFQIELRQQADYRFEIRFDNPAIAPLVCDETAPVGNDAGPSPARLLAAALAQCLASSLLFAMRKFHSAPEPVRAVATVRFGRNPAKRLRVTHIAVDLHIGVAGAGVPMLARILDQFEDFCVVTQSVRGAIPIDVRVIDKDGAVLK